MCVQVGLDFGASLMEEVMKALNMSDDVVQHVNDDHTTTTATTATASDDDDDDDDADDDDTVSGGSDSDSQSSSTSTQTDDQQLDPKPDDNIDTVNDDQPSTSSASKSPDVQQSTGLPQSTASRVIILYYQLWCCGVGGLALNFSPSKNVSFIWKFSFSNNTKFWTKTVALCGIYGQ